MSGVDGGSRGSDRDGDAHVGGEQQQGEAAHPLQRLHPNPAVARALYNRRKVRQKSAKGASASDPARGEDATGDSPAGHGEALGAHAKEAGRAGHPEPDEKPHPPGAATTQDWIPYLGDLNRFLHDQTAAEKEALVALHTNREGHPVVGAVAEAVGGVKAGFHSVKIPDAGIWDQVSAQLEKAHALSAGDAADIEGAKREMATAVRLFQEAHRKVYEYRSRTEGGAETAITMLRGVEIGCDITLTILSAGLGAAEVNVLKLGARGVFKLAASQAGKSLLKTGLRAAAVGGADKLAQGAAGDAAAHAMGVEGEFDAAKVVREAGEAAVMNLLGVLVGGALNKVFMRAVGQIIGSRMAPEALLAVAERYGVSGVVPAELFVSKGWRFLVGVAGDGCTTALVTALAVTAEQLRTGGKKPTGEQFVSMVVEQMVRNGLLQIILTAVTHERAKTAAGAPDHQQSGAAGAAPNSQPGEHTSREAQSSPGQVARPQARQPDREAQGGAPEAQSKVPAAGQAASTQAEPGGAGPQPSTSPDAESIDLYVVGEVPKSGAERWKYIENPAVWSPERRALHEELLAEAKAQAQVFADASAHGDPTLHAMRGNTAAGKTRAMKQNPELAGPMSKAPKAAVNPDSFKPRLQTHGGRNLLSKQVHSESSMLATRFEAEITGMKTSDGKEVGSMLVDKRLPTVENVMEYARLAQSSGRRLVLHDVDAPLEVSLAGVLERQPGGDDPLPEFSIVKGGFDAVRANRVDVYSLFKNDPSLGDYELYATKADGQRIKIAEVVSGAAQVHDPELFFEVTAPPGTASEIIANKQINEETIRTLTLRLPAERGKVVSSVLRKYLGSTWKAALDAHSIERRKADSEAK